jgi:hypothetical protein
MRSQSRMSRLTALALDRSQALPAAHWRRTLRRYLRLHWRRFAVEWGRGGGRRATVHLNQMYDSLSALERYGSSVIRFSGDAITCWLDKRRWTPAWRPAVCKLPWNQFAVVGRLWPHGIAGCSGGRRADSTLKHRSITCL